MNSKAAILGKLRAAAPLEPSSLPRSSPAHGIFRDLPSANDDPLQMFLSRLAVNKGECLFARDVAHAGELLLGLLRQVEPQKISMQTDGIVAEVLNVSRELTRVDEKKLCSTFADFEVGISACDALLARSGSVVLRSDAAGGRRLSLLPPLHIVIARRAQLLHSMENWLSTLEAVESWRYATIISGPSRTADIEKVLVLGMHGPQRLAVIVIS